MRNACQIGYGSGFPAREKSGPLAEWIADHVATDDNQNTVPRHTFVVVRRGKTVQVDPIKSERIPAQYEPATNGDVAELSLRSNGYGTASGKSVHAPNDFRSITGLQFYTGQEPVGSIVYALGKTKPAGKYRVTNKTTITPEIILSYGKLGGPGGIYGVWLTPATADGLGIQEGDSGGPLVNQYGKPIGINTAGEGRGPHYYTPGDIQHMGGAKVIDLGTFAPYVPIDAAAVASPKNLAAIGTAPVRNATLPPIYPSPN